MERRFLARSETEFTSWGKDNSDTDNTVFKARKMKKARVMKVMEEEDIKYIESKGLIQGHSRHFFSFFCLAEKMHFYIMILNFLSLP